MPCMDKCTQICVNMRKYDAEVCGDMRKCAEMCRSMQKYAEVYGDMHKFVESMRKYAQVSVNIQKYAEICRETRLRYVGTKVIHTHTRTSKT